MSFSAEAIKVLQYEVEKRLSHKRFMHTLNVAKASVKLSEFCLPELKSEAEIAGLLHDVTKEYSDEMQLEIINRYGVILEEGERDFKAVIHSFTAPVIIQRDFPQFATPEILSAVYNHTIGSPDMRIFDEIIFLADYIEDSRTYASCVNLRNYVWSNMEEGNEAHNVHILHKACLKAINSTILNLLKLEMKIHPKNILTRNALLSKI